VIWVRSWRTDPRVRPLADRHYNRQSVGAQDFCPPGRCLVFTTADYGAFWVTSWPFAEYVKHAWAGAWVCSAFRRETGPLASAMIRDAVAATRAHYGEPPELGMVSFVDASKVRRSREPGRVFRLAGFRLVGETKGGLLAYQLPPADMPAAERAIGDQASLFAEASP